MVCCCAHTLGLPEKSIELEFVIMLSVDVKQLTDWRFSVSFGFGLIIDYRRKLFNSLIDCHVVGQNKVSDQKLKFMLEASLKEVFYIKRLSRSQRRVNLPVTSQQRPHYLRFLLQCHLLNLREYHHSHELPDSVQLLVP